MVGDGRDTFGRISGSLIDPSTPYISSYINCSLWIRLLLFVLTLLSLLGNFLALKRMDVRFWSPNPSKGFIFVFGQPPSSHQAFPFFSSGRLRFPRKSTSLFGKFGMGDLTPWVESWLEGSWWLDLYVVFYLEEPRRTLIIFLGMCCMDALL